MKLHILRSPHANGPGAAGRRHGEADARHGLVRWSAMLVFGAEVQCRVLQGGGRGDGERGGGH